MALVNRIPALRNCSFKGMTDWFAEMSSRDLLFHPDDDPAEIIEIETGKRMFSKREVESLREILTAMFDRQGDRVYDAAYPIFMRIFRKLVGV